MRAIALVCAALALAVLTGLTELRVPEKPFVFEVEVSSNVSGRIQVYYDIGRSFSEAESTSTTLFAAANRTLIRLPLPSGTYRAIRFDPIDRPADVTFAHARVVTAHGALVRPLPVTAFVANDQIESFVVTREVVSFRVPPGRDDPNLTVTFDRPLTLELGWSRRISYAARSAAAWFFGWLAAMGALAWIWQRRAKLRGFASRRPGLAIGIVAALCAVIACYPVVFAGKSFVSPNTTALLRATPPTVPGYTDFTRTDLHAPDPAVVLWQNVPYSAVEHDAIFRDHELPLWNRYLSSGVTLLGQGQSMLGDPIHLLVIATRGASWAWDAKFVIARMLFGAGVGIAVWAFTGDVIAALISVVAAVFVAFFNYRFNHPAIFSVAYAPWIAAAWALIARAPHPGALRGPLVLWLVANVAVLGSGTVKEAYGLILLLNGCGLSLWATTPRAAPNLVGPVLVTLACGIAITAPLWWPFFDALRQGANAYEKPTVWQAPRAWLIGLFDDLFYVETNRRHVGFIPSANFLVLLGVAFALVCPRKTYRLAGAAIIFLSGATCAVLIAHEFVPARWIAAVPLLRGVYHVHNTFDAAAVVMLTLAAGCGFHAAREVFQAKHSLRSAAVAVGFVAALLIAYFHDLRQVWATSPNVEGWIAGVAAHRFFYVNLFLMLGGCAGLVALARCRTLGGRTSLRSAIVAILILGALLYRHGLHLNIGFAESYLTFPMTRADLDAPSPSVALARADARGEPFRIIGTDANLINGWNAMYRLEGLNGPDAIMNREYRELLTTARLVPEDDWRLRVNAAHLEPQRPVLDFLGARYVFTDTPNLSAAGYALVGDADLAVYRSSSAWPRAYFTTEVLSYRTPSEYLKMVRAFDRPFAAIQVDDEAARLLARYGHTDAGASRTSAIRAESIRLSANRTTFRILATGPGVAVLQEAWLKSDFIATVDGIQVPYFRVNHAFKAVEIPTAGLHVISFAYWPRHFSAALGLAAIGFVSFALVMWTGTKPKNALGRTESPAVP